jgi:hypothetical protein
MIADRRQIGLFDVVPPAPKIVRRSTTNVPCAGCGCPIEAALDGRAHHVTCACGHTTTTIATPGARA